MKKYQNVSNDLVCVEFEGRAQFLYTGQSVTTDEVIKRVPKGVKVTEMDEPTPVVEKVTEEKPEAEVKVKPKASSRKKRTKKVNSGE